MFFLVTGIIVIVQFSAIIRWGYFTLRTPPPGFLYVQTVHAFMTNAVMGAYYAFFLSILLAFILNMPVTKDRIRLTLLAVIFSFALFNTFSRSAYVGIVVSFLVLAMLKEKRLFLIILLLLVFSPIYMETAVLERITFTIRSLRPVILDPSALARLIVWKKGIQVFFNNAIFGTGYWTARWAIRAEAHSQYLAILVETGIVGFSVFCWLIIRMFKNAIILLKKADTDFLKALGLGYIAGLSAILTTCFFTETLEAFRLLGPLWFVTGLVTVANRLLSEKAEKLDIDST